MKIWCLSAYTKGITFKLAFIIGVTVIQEQILRDLAIKNQLI